MKEFTTSKGSFIGVGLPKDATDIEDPVLDEATGNLMIPYYSDGQKYIDIPPGQWSIVLTTPCSEEEAARVVQIVFDSPRLYADYSKPQGMTFMPTGAIESLHSLLELHGFTVRNKYGEREPEQKSIDKQTLYPSNQNEIRQWHTAESQIERVVILKVNEI